MTKYTHQRYTSHFGLICKHSQWLIQLSCLNIEFSPSTIARYIEYCSRSVLAKAQLYHWIQNMTGRPWLIEVGDTNGLHRLAPASLKKEYAEINESGPHNAPACLTNSSSSLSKEFFHHVVASCSFTSTSLHTGDAGRP
jgi:hypothetical protein